MKKYILLLMVLISFVSCQTRVVDQQKPLQNNTLELYHKYSVQTTDAKVTKLKVLKIDDDNIYGKNNQGEDITINKNDIREVKQFNWIASVGIAIVAVAALIFIPI